MSFSSLKTVTEGTNWKLNQDNLVELFTTSNSGESSRQGLSASPASRNVVYEHWDRTQYVWDVTAQNPAIATVLNTVIYNNFLFFHSCLEPPAPSCPNLAEHMCTLLRCLVKSAVWLKDCERRKYQKHPKHENWLISSEVVHEANSVSKSK